MSCRPRQSVWQFGCRRVVDQPDRRLGSASPGRRDVVRRGTTYGVGEDAQVRAVNIRAVGPRMHFTAQRRNGIVLPDLEVVLNRRCGWSPARRQCAGIVS